MRPVKQKRCKYCKEPFTPLRPLQQVCSFGCSLAISKEVAAKKEKQDWRQEKKRLVDKNKTHKDYLKILQIVFNNYIRKRDEKLPCVSCGAVNCEEFHAGHYIASTYAYLRFNEFNVWKQCSRCNTHLRGNSVPYRIELIKRIGLAEVERLEESRHNEMKLSIPEIQEQIKVYKLKIKSLA